MRRWLAHWRLALGAVLVVTIGVGTRLAIPRLAFFRIGAVEVEGIRYLEEHEVVAELGIPAGASILVPLAPIAARAALVPGIRSATVERRWPGTLRVTVVEAAPVAVTIEDGRAVVIDDRAEPLPYPPGRVELSLPLAPRDSATAALLGRLRHADPAWYARFDRTEGAGDDIRLVAGGRTIRLARGADEVLLRRAAAVRDWLAGQGIAWEELDMRFRGRVFVRREAA